MNTIPFTIKLKYKVGKSIQYLEIDNFSYKMIKNGEMVEKEKEKYIKIKEKEYDISLNLYYKRNKTSGKNYSILKNDFDAIENNLELKYKTWVRDDEHFADFQNYINNAKKDNIPFKIIYCPYYYTYDSLLEYTQKDDDDSDLKVGDLNYYKKELEVIKDNANLKTEIKNWISKLNETRPDLENKKKPTDEYDTWATLFYLKHNQGTDKVSKYKIAKEEAFTKLHIDLDDESNEAKTQKIKRNKLAFLLFETDMRIRLGNLGIQVINLSDDKSSEHKLLFNIETGNNINNFEETNKIYSFSTIDKIYNVISNILYLKKQKFIRVVIDKKQNQSQEKQKTEYIEFNDVFNLDILENHVKLACNILLNQFKQKIGDYKLIRNKYRNNINEFFLENKNIEDPTQNDNHLVGYFNYLRENFMENLKLDNLPSAARIQKSDTKPLNTDKIRKSIVNEYAKYILDTDDLESNDAKSENQLYNRMKADRTKLLNIITYHNLHKILETLYLNKGCILKVPLFEIVNDQIQEPKGDPTYIKVLKINPTKLDIDERRKAFNKNKLEAIFEIEFEKIYTFSNIKFHLNIIDIANPDTLLQNLLDTVYKTEQKKIKDKIADKEKEIIAKKKKKISDLPDNDNNLESLEKELKILESLEPCKKITDLNNTYSIYGIYSNKIFTNIETNNKILIEPTFDYEKILYNFNLLKNNILTRYQNEKIENMRDIFLNSKIFEYIKKENKGPYDKTFNNTNDKEKYIIKIINDFYLNKFFFKIKSNLNINNKIAEIVDVQTRIIDNISITKQKNIQDYNKEEGVKLFLKEPSKNTRLAMDDVDNIYNVFLDVSVFYKDKISDKVPISLRIKTFGNCIQKANTLDKIMYDYLQDLYPKNLLENKLRKKESSNLQNKEEKPKNDIEIQKGGKKRDTKKIINKKIINKKNHNTLKNIVKYYAI